MKLVIDIDEEEYKAILDCAKNTPGYLTICERMIADGKPLDKIRAEIEQKCCITVGRGNDPAITLYDVFQIIDKYKAESEDKE